MVANRSHGRPWRSVGFDPVFFPRASRGPTRCPPPSSAGRAVPVGAARRGESHASDARRRPVSHSTKRRQHVLPEPHLISRGNICHGNNQGCSIWRRTCRSKASADYPCCTLGPRVCKRLPRLFSRSPQTPYSGQAKTRHPERRIRQLDGSILEGFGASRRAWLGVRAVGNSWTEERPARSSRREESAVRCAHAVLLLRWLGHLKCTRWSEDKQ